MTYGTAFYLVSQLPAEACGVALLLLFLMYSMVAAYVPQRSGLRWRDSFSNIDYRRATWIVSGVSLFAMAQSLLLPYALSPLTVVHTMLYVVLFGAQRRWRNSEVSHGVVLFITWLNFAILLSCVIPAAREVFFIEKAGGLRFKAYYSEPSVAAFTYVFNMQQLWAGGVRRGARAAMAVNLLCVLLTFSGSGLALLMLLGTARFGGNQKLLRSLLLLGLVALGLIVIRLVAADAFDQMLVARLQGILGEGMDNSTFLRFVAPWLFLTDMVHDGNFAWTGTGLGGLVNYISQNQIHLWYLVDFKGEPVYNINNGYAALIALLGVPLSILLLLILLYQIRRSAEPRANKALLLAYPFFSGFLIHPFIWLLLAEVLWQGHVEQRPIPDAAST